MVKWTDETVANFKRVLGECRDYGVCAQHALELIESLELKISRIGGVLVDVLEWAEAQDEDLVPDWVENLSAAVTEDAK